MYCQYDNYFTIQPNSFHIFQVKSPEILGTSSKLSYRIYKDSHLYIKKIMWVERDFNQAIESDFPEEINDVNIDYKYSDKYLNITIKNVSLNVVDVYLLAKIYHYNKLKGKQSKDKQSKDKQLKDKQLKLEKVINQATLKTNEPLKIIEPESSNQISESLKIPHVLEKNQLHIVHSKSKLPIDKIKSELPKDFDWVVYRSLNADLKHICSYNDAVRHYVNHGKNQKRMYKFPLSDKIIKYQYISHFPL